MLKLSNTPPRPLTLRELTRILGGLIGTFCDFCAPEDVRRAVRWWAETDVVWTLIPTHDIETRFSSTYALASLHGAVNGAIAQALTCPQEAPPSYDGTPKPRLNPEAARHLTDREILQVFSGFVGATVQFCPLVNVRNAFRWWAETDEAWKVGELTSAAVQAVTEAAVQHVRNREKSSS